MRAIKESTLKKEIMTYCGHNGILAYRKSGAFDAGAPEILIYRPPVLACIEAKTAVSGHEAMKKTMKRQFLHLRRAAAYGAVSVIVWKRSDGVIRAAVKSGQNNDFIGYQFGNVSEFVIGILSGRL